MAPARTSNRRAQRTQNTRKQQPQPPQDVQPQPPPPQAPPIQQLPPPPQSSPDEQHGEVQKLFLDPMSGQPLQLYVEKDVENRDSLIESVIVSVMFTAFGRVRNARKCFVGGRELTIMIAIWRGGLSGIQWRHVYPRYVASKRVQSYCILICDAS